LTKEPFWTFLERSADPLLRMPELSSTANRMKASTDPSAQDHARSYLRGKRILVTGVCGTVGKQLVHQLLANFEIESLIGIDNNESELAFLEERYSKRYNAHFLLADIRDLNAMMRETRNIDVLFHAAAYKHVSLCERSPLEAIQTNVLGVQNVAHAAAENGVGRLVFTSSDKAVNPTNVMGTSKLMGERLITAAALDPNHSGATFLSTRFGNVLGSRGSVIPIFRDQIRNGGPVTLTESEMTRFIMSLHDAVRLVIESMVLGQPGDVLITKMPAIRISDLAEVMVREFAPICGRRPQDIEIKVIGPKPGEKRYEELMNDEETRRALELERYFVVRPAFTTPGKSKPHYEELRTAAVEKPYNSSNVAALSQAELTDFLRRNDLVSGAPE
jgi:FlaA1/EpsC-like NDP-sugar epimerase